MAGPAPAQCGKRYIVVPDSPHSPAEWLMPLHRTRPNRRPHGHLLIELRVDRGRAIDVPARARRLSGLDQLRSGTGNLMARGDDLLLPARSYGRLEVRRLWRPCGTQYEADAGRADDGDAAVGARRIRADSLTPAAGTGGLN